MIQQEMSMTAASMFWLDILHNCHLDRSLPLPYDRYRLSNEHRTGRGISISFDFDQDLSHDFLHYASSNNINPQHLALAIYYVFLFKLTNGERDLCIGMNTDGRYKEELMSVIGMFVNVIPLRCQLDPHWSFQQLVEHVQEMVISSLEYSYFPLQCILIQHPKISKPAFLDTSFVFISIGSQNVEKEVIIGGNRLHAGSYSIKIGEDEIMSKFDFSLTIQHNRRNNQLSCKIDASLDLFDAATVDKIGQRFHSMLTELFTITHFQIEKAIHELSIVLPDEKLLIQSMNNTEVLFPPVTCIHHEFVFQVIKHPQKLAVELDDQSLTYSELLYYSQVLSLHLMNEHGIVSGEIICQCVERSLSMVSCIRKHVLILIRYIS
jgi:non-ribosomal peptide synthetase component F